MVEHAFAWDRAGATMALLLDYTAPWFAPCRLARYVPAHMTPILLSVTHGAMPLPGVLPRTCSVTTPLLQPAVGTIAAHMPGAAAFLCFRVSSLPPSMNSGDDTMSQAGAGRASSTCHHSFPFYFVLHSNALAVVRYGTFFWLDATPPTAALRWLGFLPPLPTASLRCCYVVVCCGLCTFSLLTLCPHLNRTKKTWDAPVLRRYAVPDRRRLLPVYLPARVTPRDVTVPAALPFT